MKAEHLAICMCALREAIVAHHEPGNGHCRVMSKKKKKWWKNDYLQENVHDQCHSSQEWISQQVHSKLKL